MAIHMQIARNLVYFDRTSRENIRTNELQVECL